MKLVELGTSGIRASVVGLGTFAMGGWFWGGTDEGKAIEAIHASLDMGVNLIDTAPIYGFGLAESIIAKAIKGRRQQVVLATKVGLRWDTDRGEFFTHADELGPRDQPSKFRVQKFLGPESIALEVEGSLRRLGTDVIDLYQTHWQENTTPIEVTLEALEKLKQQGKIRAIGVSNVTVEHLMRYGQIASAQEKFSLIDRGIERSGVVDYCVEHRIALMTYFTMEMGLLTGGIHPERRFPHGDTRQSNPLFTPENISHTNAVLQGLRPYAEKYGVTLAQLVIALTTSQRGITHALIGARDASQATENAAGGYISLEAADIAAMSAQMKMLKQVE